MTPTEKKLALIQHITALEADALAEVYQTLLPEKEEEAHSENDVKSYVLRVEVPAADWVFFELLLARMRWEFEVLQRKSRTAAWEKFRKSAAEIEWEEHETVEYLLSQL